jgi:gluconokinase
LPDDSSGDGRNRVWKDDGGKTSRPAIGLAISGCRLFSPSREYLEDAARVPLTDEDREPWLAAIHAELLKCAAKNQDAVLACSALKQSYRETLASGVDLRICYLRGTYSEISARLKSRTGHFAGEAILAGQFADLEEPRDALVLRVSYAPEDIVLHVLRKLNLG